MASSPARCRRRGIARRCARRRSPRYALDTARREGIFDQYPDIRSPIYKGVAGEDPRADAAVAATAGRVVLHDGAVATTFFHTTAGGRTESSANAFGRRALPYLRSVDDPEDRISPHYRWALSLSGAEMERRLGSLVDGGYRGVRVLERGDSPRILRAEVVWDRRYGPRPATSSRRASGCATRGPASAASTRRPPPRRPRRAHPPQTPRRPASSAGA